jgi:hypothetical protein
MGESQVGVDGGLAASGALTQIALVALRTISDSLTRGIEFIQSEKTAGAFTFQLDK